MSKENSPDPVVEDPGCTRDRVICDLNGDVNLLVEGNTLIRVNTNVLSVASKPFHAMFHGPFLEAQNLSSTNPPTIEFPEDDGQCMAALCLILHWKPLPKECIRPHAFIRLAILADKYDCTRLLNLVVMDHQTEFQPTAKTSCDNLFMMLVYAYFMGDDHMFRQASINLALLTPSTTNLLKYGPTDVPAMPVPGHSLVDQVIRLHENLRFTLCSRSLQLSKAWVHGVITHDIGQTLRVVDTLTDMFQIRSSILDILERMAGFLNRFDPPYPKPEFVPDPPLGRSQDAQRDAKDTWRSLVDKFRADGLCLDCVRQGVWSNSREHTHDDEAES